MEQIARPCDDALGDRRTSDIVWQVAEEQDLETIINRCGASVKELYEMVRKNDGLSPSKEFSKRIWDRLGFATENLSDVKSRLISHTNLLTAFLVAYGVRMHTVVNRNVTNMSNRILESLAEVVRILTDRYSHDGASTRSSITTAYHDEDKKIWRDFRRELIGLGVRSKEIYEHKAQLRSYALHLALPESRGDVTCSAGATKDSKVQLHLHNSSDNERLINECACASRNTTSITTTEVLHRRNTCDDESLQYQAHVETDSEDCRIKNEKAVGNSGDPGDEDAVEPTEKQNERCKNNSNDSSKPITDRLTQTMRKGNLECATPTHTSSTLQLANTSDCNAPTDDARIESGSACSLLDQGSDNGFTPIGERERRPYVSTINKDNTIESATRRRSFPLADPRSDRNEGRANVHLRQAAAPKTAPKVELSKTCISSSELGNHRRNEGSTYAEEVAGDVPPAKARESSVRLHLVKGRNEGKPRLVRAKPGRAARHDLKMGYTLPSVTKPTAKAKMRPTEEPSAQPREDVDFQTNSKNDRFIVPAAVYEELINAAERSNQSSKNTIRAFTEQLNNNGVRVPERWQNPGNIPAERLEATDARIFPLADAAVIESFGRHQMAPSHSPAHLFNQGAEVRERQAHGGLSMDPRFTNRNQQPLPLASNTPASFADIPRITVPTAHLPMKVRGPYQTSTNFPSPLSFGNMIPASDSSHLPVSNLVPIPQFENRSQYQPTTTLPAGPPPESQKLAHSSPLFWISTSCFVDSNGREYHNNYFDHQPSSTSPSPLVLDLGGTFLPLFCITKQFEADRLWAFLTDGVVEKLENPSKWFPRETYDCVLDAYPWIEGLTWQRGRIHFRWAKIPLQERRVYNSVELYLYIKYRDRHASVHDADSKRAEYHQFLAELFSQRSMPDARGS